MSELWLSVDLEPGEFLTVTKLRSSMFVAPIGKHALTLIMGLEYIPGFFWIILSQKFVQLYDTPSVALLGFPCVRGKTRFGVVNVGVLHIQEIFHFCEFDRGKGS